MKMVLLKVKYENYKTNFSFFTKLCVLAHFKDVKDEQLGHWTSRLL